jgi:predicted ATPase
MMIKQFRVQNYKALRDVTLNLTPLHVLIGPNDSGKTSLLEAIAALCRSTAFPIADAFLGQWDGRALLNGRGFHSSSLKLSARFEASDSRYVLECRFPPSGKSCEVVEEEWGNYRARSSPASDSYVFRHCVQGESVQLFGGVPKEELNSWVTGLRAVHQSLAGVGYYRFMPKVLALPAAPDSRRGFTLEVSGFGLARYLDELLGLDRERFAALEAAFTRLFPSVNSIKLSPEPGYRTVADSPLQVPVLGKAEGKGLCFEMKDEFLVNASQSSDGMLLVLAYLALLHSPTPPRVLLIEEPENGIHPKRLQEVLAILRQLVSEQQHTQIILTTHSPYVLDSFQPDEVTLCRKNPGGAVSVHPLSESKTVSEQIDLFSLGEIWTAAGDDDLAIPVDSAAVVEEVAP